MPVRLAIVATHPIQYYAPWFADLARSPELELRVFYLWNPAQTGAADPGFQQAVSWDIPLLEGYDSEFVPNASAHPGTNRFDGLNCPELATRLAAWAPNVVLLTAYNYRGLIPFIMSWRSTPLIFRGDSHRLVAPRGLRSAAKAFLVRTLFSRFAGCLYVGEANRQYFKMHSVKDDRLFFTPHAVDGARFAASIDQRASVRESLGIDEVCVVFLFAGKFQMKKRPDLLVAAFRAMPGDGVLLLAGAGEMEPALRRAAAGDERIRFLPFHNQSQMPGLLAAADVVVLPSQGSGETWGLIINEAQALGRPVIVSDHVGCAADLVAAGPDGAPGLIVPAGSRDALTEAMRRLIGDSALRDEMGAAARRRVARYSYAHATAGLLAAVRSVSKREGTRA